MKTHQPITNRFIALLALSFASLLLLTGCQPSAEEKAAAEKRTAAVEQKIAALEKQVGTLTEQNRDLRAKSRASHSWGNSPLADFFAAPEFWQCTYDSSWADCSNRCSQQTAAGYAECLKKPEGPERVTCINENSTRGQNCLKQCPVKLSPTELPGCLGGGGPA